MLTSALHSVQAWMDGLPVVVQWLMLFVLGALPFVEAFLGTAIGAIAGIPWPLALVAAGSGNLAAITVAAVFGQRLHRWWRSRRPAPDEDDDADARVTVRRLLRKYGTVGASILAPILIPSLVASFLIASSGAPRRVQLTVQTGTLLVLGCIGGVLASAGVDLLAR